MKLKMDTTEKVEKKVNKRNFSRVPPRLMPKPSDGPLKPVKDLLTPELNTRQERKEVPRILMDLTGAQHPDADSQVLTSGAPAPPPKAPNKFLRHKAKALKRNKRTAGLSDEQLSAKTREYHKRRTRQAHALLEWQASAMRYLLAPGKKYRMLVGARQIGKTHLLTITALILSSTQNVLVISHQMEHAKEFINRVRLDAIPTLQAFGYDVSAFDFTQTSVKNKQTGFYIKALTSKPSSLRGFTGHVIFEEMSISRHDPEEMLSEALSVVNSDPNFKLLVATNAAPQGTFVHSFIASDEPKWRNRRQQFEPLVINIYDAYPDKWGGVPQHIASEDPYWDDKLKEWKLSTKMTISDEGWRQFYLCEFIGGNSLVLSPSDVAGARYEPSGHTWDNILCIDPGTNDPMGVCVLGFDGAKWVVRHSNMLWDVRLDAHPSIIQGLAKEWNAQRIVIDRGTIGKAVVEALEHDSRVVPVNYSNDFKASNLQKLRAMVNGGFLGFPSGENAYLIEQLTNCTVNDKGLYEKKSGWVGKGQERRRHHFDALDALIGAVSEATLRVGSRQVPKRVVAAVPGMPSTGVTLGSIFGGLRV